MHYTIVETTWGVVGFVTRDGRLVGTFLPDDENAVRRAIQRRWPQAVESPNLLPRFSRAMKDYFAGKRVRFEVDVDLSDHPPFRQAVLEACRRVPYGDTASYRDLARAVGCPGGARAVGGAMAHNPLPVLIPCHRVLRSDGSLGGFSSRRGAEEKLRLLRLEGAAGCCHRPHGVGCSSTTEGKKAARRALATGDRA